MSVTLAANEVFIDLEYYCMALHEVDYASSAPLYSWNRRKPETSTQWGDNRFLSDLGVWVIEFCLVRGPEMLLEHHVPGAYIKTIKNSRSEKTLRYIWHNLNDRYTFKSNEITSQRVIEDYLRENITSNDVIFYKGGSAEKTVAGLLNAASFNIEELGVTKPDLSCEPLGGCKVHVRNKQHCARSEVSYYIKNIGSWLPEYRARENARHAQYHSESVRDAKKFENINHYDKRDVRGYESSEDEDDKRFDNVYENADAEMIEGWDSEKEDSGFLDVQ